MPINEKPTPYVKSPHPMFHTTPEKPGTWEPSQLHIIAPITNTCRYSSRYHLFEKFEKMVLDAGAKLWVIEAAFANRPHVVTQAGNPQHIQLRTNSEIWHKENLINLAINRLPYDWEYVAWIDPDVSFVRPDWINETLNQLQHFDIVQMFSVAHDLSPQYEIIRSQTGFMYRYRTEGFNIPDATDMEVTDYDGTRRLVPKKPYYAHPGYAWAAKRKAIDDLGGLLDKWILGSADYHMAYAMIGKAKQTINPNWTKHLKDLLLEWEQRAEKHIRRNVGYVSGSLLHYWHGRKKDRKYNDRYRILIDHEYDPVYDLKRDSQGLWQLTDRSLGLRDHIREYFRTRNEDSTECEM